MTDRDGAPDPGPSARPAPPIGYPAAPVAYVDQSVAAGPPAPGLLAARSSEQPEWRTTLRAAALIVLVLAVVGALLGMVWAWWSPPVPAGEVLRGGLLRDEKEGFAAADGRFVVITVSVGLVAGIGLWFVREQRGPVTAIALGVGGLVGSVLTGLVGYAVGGGTNHAPVGAIIAHLSLEVQMRGVYLFEAAIAVLVYAVLAGFAAEDDLGRPDPFHDARARRGPTSVGPEDGLQDRGRHGNGAGFAQQHNLSAQ